MKIGVFPLCFFEQMLKDKTMSLEDWVKMAVEMGLDGIESHERLIGELDERTMTKPVNYNPTRVKKFADAAHRAGLQFSEFGVDSSFFQPQDRDEMITRIKRGVDTAKVFKTNILRVTAGWPPTNISNDERNRLKNDKAIREVAVQSCASGLKACLDYAEKKKVMLALENHPVIGENVEEFIRVLELVNDKRLKVNLDTANVGRGRILELTRLVADRVVHVHVKDFLVTNGQVNYHLVYGTGEVDNKSVFKILKNAGYDGWLSLEIVFGTKEDARLGVDNIRKAWNSA